MTAQSTPLRRVVQLAYNRAVRPRLPRKFAVYAGVPARDEPLLDATDRHPDYKRGLIEAIHDHVDSQYVTLVGAGRGVSTVHCLRAGARHVTAYEAAQRMLTTAQETVDIEDANAPVEWRHALVGDAIEVYGPYDDADRIDPPDLDPGDVLVMDCEGAEVSILSGLSKHPDTVIVETHPERGVPTGETWRQLVTESAGYRVSERRFRDDQEHETKRVLIGERQ